MSDGTGLPLDVDLSAGQAHESRFATPLLRRVRVKRPGRGRPRSRPRAVAGDKGYSYAAVRRDLRRRGVRAVIPERKDQRARRAHRPGRKPHFDKVLYRRRNVIERCVGWLKEGRRLATRYEKLAIHYLGVLRLGMMRRLLRYLVTLSDTP